MADLIDVRLVKVYKIRKTPLVKDFKTLFRFEEMNVEWLSNHFLEDSLETRGGALSSLQKMKICLRYLADPGYQSGIGEELGISQGTVSLTTDYVVNRIVDKAEQWIKFPRTENDFVLAKELWQSKYRFPTAIGAIDCTHVGILKPRLHGDEFINRKLKPTINVQATCNALEIFTSVDASWPGSVHDSRIWKNSQIKQVMRTTPNAVLIADDGYGIEPSLMTPFANPNEAERNYNTLLKRERCIIERCFGQLKRRFPILQYVCRVKLANVPKIIIASIILHNVAKTLRDPDFDALEEDRDEGLPVEELYAQGGRRLRLEGQAVRRNLAQIINQF